MSAMKALKLLSLSELEPIAGSATVADAEFQRVEANEVDRASGIGCIDLDDELLAEVIRWHLWGFSVGEAIGYVRGALDMTRRNRPTVVRKRKKVT